MISVDFFYVNLMQRIVSKFFLHLEYRRTRTCNTITVILERNKFKN